ncbi:hypothetical protein [Paenibacillus sp. BAC0078]
MGIEVLDQVIIGGDHFYSLKRAWSFLTPLCTSLT